MHTTINRHLLPVGLALTTFTGLAFAAHIPPPPPPQQNTTVAPQINYGFEIFKVYQAPNDPEYDRNVLLCKPGSSCKVYGTAQQLLDQQFGAGVVAVVAFAPVIRTYETLADYEVTHVIVSFRRLPNTK